MVDYLRQKAIEGPWPIGRAHPRLRRWRMPWRNRWCGPRRASPMASTPRGLPCMSNRPTQQPSPEQLKAVDAALALAERLGAEVKRQSSSDIAAEVLQPRPAREHHADHRRPLRARASQAPDWDAPSPTQLLQQAHGMAIHVLAGEDEGGRRPLLNGPALAVGRSGRGSRRGGGDARRLEPQPACSNCRTCR